MKDVSDIESNNHPLVFFSKDCIGSVIDEAFHGTALHKQRNLATTTVDFVLDTIIPVFVVGDRFFKMLNLPIIRRMLFEGQDVAYPGRRENIIVDEDLLYTIYKFVGENAIKQNLLIELTNMELLTLNNNSFERLTREVRQGHAGLSVSSNFMYGVIIPYKEMLRSKEVTNVLVFNSLIEVGDFVNVTLPKIAEQDYVVAAGRYFEGGFDISLTNIGRGTRSSDIPIRYLVVKSKKE